MENRQTKTKPATHWGWLNFEKNVILENFASLLNLTDIRNPPNFDAISTENPFRVHPRLYGKSLPLMVSTEAPFKFNDFAART